MANQATYQISPPEGFPFSKPMEWPKWIHRFESFQSASGLDKKSQESQVNTLLYTMGEEADNIYESLGLTAEKKQYGAVKEKFEGYFIPRRNAIFERAVFNQRVHKKGGSVDNFITSLSLFQSIVSSKHYVRK